MRKIWAIAIITFKEGLRNKILFGAVIFSLVIIFLSIMISGLFMRDVLKILLDISLSAVNLAGILIPFFMVITLLAADIEKKSIYSLLSKNLSRSNYIYGRFLGFALLTAAVMAIPSLATLLSVVISQFIYPANFFKTLSYPAIISAQLFGYCEVLILISCAMFWCSVTTSSFLASLLTLCTYLVGQTVEELLRFIEVQASGMDVSITMELLLRGLYYLFPNLSAFDIKQLASNGKLLGAGEFFTLLAYCIFYTATVLFLSSFFLNKKELP